jgi:hypothetical protein
MPALPREISRDLLVLQQWARFGKTYAPKAISRPKWSAVEELILAAKPYLRENAARLRALLKDWSDKFGMQDPFLNDLGVHRWIDKETSYSDWLAWVLERLEPGAVLEVLGVETTFDPEQAGRCLVRRESQLDKRYIDLLIRFENMPDYAIGVEVKTYDSQYAKQRDYWESLRSLYGKDLPCILLALPQEINDNQLHGFTLRSWRKIAIALRLAIAESVGHDRTNNQIVTAISLGFVAAVEQSLLGFSPSVPRRVMKNEPALISEDLVKYLEGDK